MTHRSSTTRRAAITLLAITLPITTLAAPAPSMAEAQQAYYQGLYARSLALFVKLAEAQDAEAAECAGVMLLLGEPQYGAEVRRNVPHAKALLLQAARSGRAGAGTLLNMIERTD